MSLDYTPYGPLRHPVTGERVEWQQQIVHVREVAARLAAMEPTVPEGLDEQKYRRWWKYHTEKLVRLVENAAVEWVLVWEWVCGVRALPLVGRDGKAFPPEKWWDKSRPYVSIGQYADMMTSQWLEWEEGPRYGTRTAEQVAFVAAARELNRQAWRVSQERLGVGGNAEREKG